MKECLFQRSFRSHLYVFLASQLPLLSRQGQRDGYQEADSQ